MEISQKEESILTLLKELSPRQEKVLRMYFGLVRKSKTSIEEMGQDFDLTSEEVIQIKNEGIREFIKMILSIGMFGTKEKKFTDDFLESADSEFLDNFMNKFLDSKKTKGEQ